MEKVIELYSQKAARSESLLKLMKALNYKVNQELRLIKECNNCIGMIESLTRFGRTVRNLVKFEF